MRSRTFPVDMIYQPSFVMIDFERFQKTGSSFIVELMVRSRSLVDRKDLKKGVPRNLLVQYKDAEFLFVESYKNPHWKTNHFMFRMLVDDYSSYLDERRVIVNAYLFYKEHGGDEYET